MVRIHVYDACAAPCDDPEIQLVLSIGNEGSGEFSRGGHDDSVEHSPLVLVPDQLAVVFELQLSQPEGNTSGGLRRRAILDLQGSPFVYCFLSSFIFLSSFHGIFFTESRVSPEGRWFSRNFGWQDVTVPPQNTGVGFVLLFVVIFFYILLNTEEDRVNGYQGVRLMDSPTFSTSRSTCLGDLHAYASTSAHHDVYTGGSLLRIMQHFQTQTSTYGFLFSGILLGATLFI